MGGTEGLAGLQLRPGDGISRHVMQTGQPYRSDDMPPDPLNEARGHNDLAGSGPVAVLSS